MENLRSQVAPGILDFGMMTTKVVLDEFYTLTAMCMTVPGIREKRPGMGSTDAMMRSRNMKDIG